MKSRKILSVAVSALAVIAAVALIFTACESSFEEKIRPETKLLSLTIQPIDFDTSGQPVNKPGVEQLTVEAIPEPVNEDDWDNPLFNLAEGDSQQLWFLLEEDVATARIVVDNTPGTVVSWGIGTSGTRPQRFTRPGEPLPFGDDDVIYVRVSTRDEGYRSHYRIHARLASPVTLLSLITFAGRETSIKPAEDGSDDWAEARDNAPELPVSISLKEGTNGSNILATKLNDNSTVRYAKVAAGEWNNSITLSSLNFEYEENREIYIYDDETEEDILYWGSNIPFEDQDVLVAEVTAQNQHDKNYYKFRVSVGHIVNIAKLEMAAGPEVSQILSLGVPNDDWDAVVSGNFATAAATPTFAVRITLEDEDGDYEFVKIDNHDAVQPATFGKPETITFDNRNELAIRVKSATQTGGTPVAEMFYKVRVDLQSAIIQVQPKSNVYFVTEHPFQTGERILVSETRPITLDKPIEPLKAELDRNGNFSYQWYTANSWYGGYGFDKDGRILGDPDFTYDAYHPTTERGPGDGGFDEKNNVSFHNGGNQFYRLPVAGDPDNPDYETYAIEGATNAEYTPTIDASKRPFIASYSNQTQYYWVVIKDDTGRSVTSERAIIVTEWGEKWDLGAPTGDKVTKKHHIVDLYAYANPDSSAVGLRDAPINTAPFTFHRQKRIIPITFPANFDVMEYSVATCQAKFYLADGTPWIQNWTQGDIGFEKDGQGLVLYYNLSNNNATLGLSGDSKEPQGADLTETPTHVVVKPAGEKGPTNRPPFEADGKTPKPNNDAQGWFTAYIEIVELRFEGPARER